MAARLLLAGTIVLLAACGGNGPAKQGALTEPEKATHCYWRDADSLSIRLDRIGDLVNGVMEGPSPEGERVKGTFTGALEEDVFVVLYTYEGSAGKKKLEVVWKPVDDGLLPADGERVTTQGYTLFKDRSRVNFGSLVREFPCSRMEH